MRVRFTGKGPPAIGRVGQEREVQHSVAADWIAQGWCEPVVDAPAPPAELKQVIEPEIDKQVDAPETAKGRRKKSKARRRRGTS